MDAPFSILYGDLMHRQNVQAAEARVRRLGYGRAGVERIPLDRRPFRRLVAAFARWLEAWAAGTPGADAGARA